MLLWTPAFFCALSRMIGHEAYVFGRPSDYSSLVGPAKARWPRCQNRRHRRPQGWIREARSASQRSRLPRLAVGAAAQLRAEHKPGDLAVPSITVTSPAAAGRSAARNGSVAASDHYKRRRRPRAHETLGARKRVAGNAEAVLGKDAPLPLRPVEPPAQEPETARGRAGHGEERRAPPQVVV